MAVTTTIRFEELRAGQRVRITQRVKVGLKIWSTQLTGTVVRTERRRNGLHVKRNFDDHAYTDLVLLHKDVNGQPSSEETTVALDEYTQIEPN